MQKEIYVIGNLRLDPNKHALQRADKSLIGLSPLQFATLLALARHGGTSVDDDTLIREIWPPDKHKTASNESLRTHVKDLKKKLGADSCIDRDARGYFLTWEVVVVHDDDHQQPPALRPKLAANQSTGTSSLKRPLLVGAVLLVIVTACLAFMANRLPTPARRAMTKTMTPAVLRRPYPGRILTRSTSEGVSPKKYALSHKALYLALSKNGDKLFATEGRGRTLSIIDTANGSVTALELPRDPGSLAVSSNGELYVGSRAGGVMILNLSNFRLPAEQIETGGPVFDIVLTPDGETLFIAMSHSGLKRISTRSREVSLLSDRPCPEHLELDPQGKRLYVPYQCSERGGHDPVEVWDVQTQTILAVIQDRPMVGDHPAVSPDGTKLLLDGADACWNPKYDHLGCQSVPTHAIHLYRTSDQRYVRSFSAPPWPQPGGTSAPIRFVDDSRFVVPGRTLLVFDSTKNFPVEELSLEPEAYEGLVFAPDNRRVYLGSTNRTSVMVLDLEDPSCSPKPEGLAILYPLDGTFADVVSNTAPAPRGKVQFAPGRVGQALSLDGDGYLSVPSTGHYEFGLHDSSLSLYVKTAESDDDMVLLDWADENPHRGIRLIRSKDQRLVFESVADGIALKSNRSLRAGDWYHVVVTRSGRELVLYINGESHDRGPLFRTLEIQVIRPMIVGGRRPGRPSFRGKLDEIAFYHRTLNAEEVRKLHRLREFAPCKPF